MDSDEEIAEGGLDREFIGLGGNGDEDSDGGIVPEGGRDGGDGGERAGDRSDQVDAEYSLMLESLGAPDDKMYEGKTQVFEWPGKALEHRYVFPTSPTPLI